MEVDKYQNQIDSLKHEVEKVNKDAYEKAIESATKSIQNVNTLLTFLGILVAVLGVLGFYGYFKTEKIREVVEKGLKEVDELKTKITKECDKAVELRSQIEAITEDTTKKVAEIDKMYQKIEKILEKAETIDRGIDKKKIAAEESAKKAEVERCFAEGNALLDKNRFEEAIQKYRRVIELAPKYAAAYSNWGGSLREFKEV
jgi:tetratricopeptide (TPR) repeat protein